MWSLHRTLSLRYLSRRWFRALLIVASIMLGVATLVATRALSETMNKAMLASSNPMLGKVDLIITNGDSFVDRDLVDDIRKVPGVKNAHPRIFDLAKIAVNGNKLPVMIMGIDLSNDMKEIEEITDEFDYSPTIPADYLLARQNDQIPVILGKDLHDELEKQKDQLEILNVEVSVMGVVVMKDKLTLLTIEKGLEKHKVARVGWIALKADAKDKDTYAAFAGHVVILDLPYAAKILGLPKGKVRRIDIALTPGTNLEDARADIRKLLGKGPIVRTMAEQNQSLQSATAGMQAAFSLCGVAALIVGMFLVYNSLSVSVAERRHEIGILLALGATRDQIWRLFAGEAFVLGLLGSILGVPLGYGLARLGLQPMQEAIGDVFTNSKMSQLELSWSLTAMAFAVGILSAVITSLIPAVQASNDNPAEAVRRVPKEASVSHLVIHIIATLLLIGIGMGMILIQDHIPDRWGTYGGLSLVMIGALLATPLFAQIGAHALIPISRRFFPIEWRIAADNLVRAPGRTGMVIGALAAGVCLIVETAGIIESNRETILTWVDSPTTSDIMIASGSPVGSGGQNNLMEESLADDLRKIPGVYKVLPSRLSTDIPFRDKRVAISTTVAHEFYLLGKQRLLDHRSSDKAGAQVDHDRRMREMELFHQMDQAKSNDQVVIISANFAALYNVHVGDTITLPSSKKDAELKFRVIGTIEDFTWNLGTIIMNRRDYVEHWQDTKVTWFEVYLHKEADPNQVKAIIATKLGAKYDLHPLTHAELRDHIDKIIERLYSIAKGQQIVVMIVASLGVVTALLISVLQRRREIGLLRAIGASQAQVVYLVLAEASLMGVFGSILGFLFAIPLQWYALQVVFLKEAGHVFPVCIPKLETAIIMLSAVVIATLAGLGPAIYGVRERIPEAIAYE